MSRAPIVRSSFRVLSFIVLIIRNVPPFCRGMDFKEAVKDKDHWDGTLSLNDFSLSASTFSDKWKMFNPSFPPWLWTPWPKHRLSSSHKEGYLSLENVCLVKSPEVCHQFSVNLIFLKWRLKSSCAHKKRKIKIKWIFSYKTNLV